MVGGLDQFFIGIRFGRYKRNSRYCVSSGVAIRSIETPFVPAGGRLRKAYESHRTSGGVLQGLSDDSRRLCVACHSDLSVSYGPRVKQR